MKLFLLLLLTFSFSVFANGDSLLNADTTVEDTNDNMDIIEDELKTLENEIQKDEEICDEMTSDLERLKVKIATIEKVKKRHCNKKAKFAHSANNHGPVTAYWVCVNTSFVASGNQTFLTWF